MRATVVSHVRENASLWQGRSFEDVLSEVIIVIPFIKMSGR